MKRFVVLFLVLFLFSAVAFAETYGFDITTWWDEEKGEVVSEELPLLVNENYVYSELPNGDIVIMLYIGNEKKADIAASFPEKRVVAIGFSAFSSVAVDYALNVDGTKYTYKADGKLKEIIVPDTVQYLNWSAFSNWFTSESKNTYIYNIPAGLRYAESGAMAGTKLTTIPYFENAWIADHNFTNLHSVKKITFSQGYDVIKEGWLNATEIEEIVFPEGIIEIEHDAAKNNRHLKVVQLPNTLQSIGEKAFENCAKLSKINLPASITYIGEGAFKGCSSKAVFTVFTGTYAEQWANEHGYKTKVLVPVTDITLSEESATINKGKSLTLKATVGPKEATNRKVEWISTDPNVATVKNGKVQAKGCGSCDIICRAADGSGVQAICHVSIIQMVSSLKAQPQKLTIPYGGTGEVEVTLKPEDATNKTLAWTSSNESICIVDENGKITAVGAGDCEIVCATTDGSNKSAKIKIHVPIFDVTEADFTVTEKDESLIPIDLHGVSVADITHKSSSDKYFLYYLDTEGLHIFPIAAGTAKITLTSELNKQDKIVYNVTIDKSALYDRAKGEIEPLRVIVTVDKKEIEPGKSYTMKWHISGGFPPYSIINSSIERRTQDFVFDGNTERIKGVSRTSGSKKIKANTEGYSHETINIGVLDGTNKVVGKSNTVKIKTIKATFGKISFDSPNNSPITISYKIEGGSGTYRVTADCSTEQKKSIATVKKTSSSEGEISFTPPPNCETISVTLSVVDKKNSNLKTSVSSKWTLSLEKMIVSECVLKPFAVKSIWRQSTNVEALNLSEYTFMSSDETVASVSPNGKVLANAPGEATITVMHGSETVVVPVVVQPYSEIIASLSFDETELSVVSGRLVRADAIITPKSIKANDIEWSSSDETVATVSTHGGITGVSNGKAVITASLPGYLDSNQHLPIATLEVEVLAIPETISCINEAFCFVGTPVKLNISVQPEHSEQTVVITAQKGTELIEDNVICSSTAGLSKFEITSKFVESVKTTSSYIALDEQNTFPSPFTEAEYKVMLKSLNDPAEQANMFSSIVNEYALLKQKQPAILKDSQAIGMQCGNDLWVCVPRKSAGAYMHWSLYGCLNWNGQQYITSFDADYMKPAEIEAYLQAFPYSEKELMVYISGETIYSNINK